MVTTNNATCGNCQGEVFVIDYRRVVLPEPPKRIALGGTTELKVKGMYMKCRDCGWQLPHLIEEVPPTVTVSFEIKAKKD